MCLPLCCTLADSSDLTRASFLSFLLKTPVSNNHLNRRRVEQKENNNNNNKGNQKVTLK